MHGNSSMGRWMAAILPFAAYGVNKKSRARAYFFARPSSEFDLLYRLRPFEAQMTRKPMRQSLQRRSKQPAGDPKHRFFMRPIGPRSGG
jgi:hypothetical protein